MIPLIQPASILSPRLILHSFSKLPPWIIIIMNCGCQNKPWTMGDFLTEVKWEPQGYCVCLRLLPGQWPSQMGLTHALSSKVRASFLHPYSTTLVIKERALFPTPMKMMDVSLCANKWNCDCSLPRWESRGNTPGFKSHVHYRARIPQEDRMIRDMCRLLYLISLLKLSTRKKPPSFFFLQVQVNCMTPLIQKTNYIYTYI